LPRGCSVPARGYFRLPHAARENGDLIYIGFAFISLFFRISSPSLVTGRRPPADL